MFGVEVNDAVLLGQKKVLEEALSTNPNTQKALQKLIRQVILAARKQVVSNIHFDNGDPRKSAQAVRTAVYKRILGANINIYNSRKSHGTQRYEAPRKLQAGQRGGNRRTRSERTKQLQGYPPQDRGFILRFVNSGTAPRFIGFRNTTRSNEGRYQELVNRVGNMERANTGHRGAISPRNFFRPVAERTLTMAVDNLATLIDSELDNILNKKK